jgi:rhamnulokinase
LVTAKHVIAVDLGAESGRVMLSSFDGARLDLTEAHRFPNIPVTAHGTLYWDVLRIWHEIQTGIKTARKDAAPASVGVDTWGVDFAFLDRSGQLLANPVHYRDPSSEGMMDWVFERVPRRELFARTGLQFIMVNGLWRLAYMAKTRSPILENAATFLTIADLFNYWLSGSKTCEFTHVSTQQTYNPTLGRWDYETLEALGIPTAMFPEILPPGTRIGEFEGIPVTLPACHDTGSAVVAVPTTTRNYAYLSSGTWSLLGLELDHPVINDATYAANLTNEGGVNGTYRLLKNIAGMWLVQQCRATWAESGHTYDYAQIAALAENAEPFLAFIDPDHMDFYPPGDMPARIRAYCARTGQRVPESHGQIIRVIYESLALKYHHVLELLRHVSGQPVERLHIIGGGSRNALLCQMSANATGIEVIAGPSEATAMGNAMVQFISLGELANLAQAREVLARSADTVAYTPQDTRLWSEQYARYRAFLENEEHGAQT